MLCTGVSNFIAKRAMQVLKCVMEAERTNGGMNFLLYEPRSARRTIAPANSFSCRDERRVESVRIKSKH